jgi:hypothetical protein
VVRVTYNGDTHQYFRLKSLLPRGNPIGTMACGWYFEAAATLSGETASYRNGDFTLRLPAEYASQLVVRTEWDRDYRGETLFRVSEKGSRDRWAAAHDTYTADATDGWLFSILRVRRDDWGRWKTGGDSGVFIFAQDEEGYCYLYTYPIWMTFCPEEGETPDPEGEAYRRYRTLYTVVSRFDAEGYFTADNGLKPFYFNAMRDFLCFTLYDGAALAETTLRADGKAYPAERVRNPLSELLWDAELTEIPAPEAAPEEKVITLERNGGASLAFWPESDLCLMSSWDMEEHWYRGGGDKAAAALEMAREVAAEEARVAAALPERSGRTLVYENRGVSLALPEEYVPYLIVGMPESGSELFRVSQRASWENGQKKHPGEDWGDGWLFSLDRFDEEQFLFEVRVHPTPTEYVAKDGEGGYYILRYPSDVRYVGDDDVIENSDEGWLEWMAWCRWSQGLAEEHVVSGADLTAFHKSFCYLETALAAFLTEDYREDFRLHFLDEDGREIDAAAAGAEAFARELVTERSSYEGDGSVGSGQLIELAFTLPYNDIDQIIVHFREGSMFFEESLNTLDGRIENRTYRMSFSGAGETVGDLMAKWYREAVQNGG